MPLPFAFDALQKSNLKTAFTYPTPPSILILIEVKAGLGEDEPVLLVWSEHLGGLHLQVALHVLQAVLLHDGQVVVGRGRNPVFVRDAIVKLSATHLHYHLQAAARFYS